MSKTALLCLLLSECLVLYAQVKAPDYSKEGMVVERLDTKVAFSPDGAREWRQALSVRVQSEAAVRQFGVLTFSYNSANEQLAVDYVRVRKADGSVVDTPASNIMDAATQVATIAPTYSDLRQKQVPVKALGVGDVLEYSVISKQSSSEVPGQFWYDQYFIDDAVVLDESLEVRVPKGIFVQISSKKLKEETNEDAGQKVYRWSHNHLAPSIPDQKPAPVDPADLIHVQLTTFKSWEEVGAWWGSLAAAGQVMTPALQEKVDSLTKGLTSDAEKAKVLYEYVSLKYRYISISFGAGRFRPHNADEVLSNQYGDCKDKHTLFATLLKAVGIQAWPALIGAGIKFNADIPSPAQFNHVITVLPDQGKYTWLDTTAEAAPFGLLSQLIRDEEALVIPPNAKPFLAKTPIEPPFPVLNKVDVTSSLSADGTLKGHFNFSLQGDLALAMRGGFRQVAPAQWQPFVQQVAYSMGYGGDVSAVTVENLEKLDQPFQYGYAYERKNFSAWAEHKISLPLPALGYGVAEDAEKPKEPAWSGLSGVQLYKASVQLPVGFSTETPKDLDLKSAFADYHSHYTLNTNVVTVERRLTIKEPKIALDQWEAYRKFSKEIQDDQGQWFILNEAVSSTQANKSSTEAAALIERARQSFMSGMMPEGRELLDQAQHLDPKAETLWLMYSGLAMEGGQTDEAISDARKEIELHPDEIQARQMLVRLLVHAKRSPEAVDELRQLVAAKPDNSAAALELGRLLVQLKRYSEIPVLMEKPIAAAPSNFHLQVMRVQGLLRSGQKEKGMAEAQAIADSAVEPVILNDLAYYVSDSTSETAAPLEWALKSVAATEQSVAGLLLKQVSAKELGAVHLLGAEWDTIGWIYFKQADLSKAEKYLNASWRLNEAADNAFHLGQVYDQQGKHDAAIHMWRLALAAFPNMEDAKEQLKRAGVPEYISEPYKPGKVQPPSPIEELNLMRTVKLPALLKQEGATEYYLLLSSRGVEDVQPVTASATDNSAIAAIRSAPVSFPFPDSGPEKIVRRGIVTCSEYTTPHCNMVFYTTSSTPSSPSSLSSANAKVVTDEQKQQHAFEKPQLLYKVEPKYPEEDKNARTEGSVMLEIIVNEEGVPENLSVVKSLSPGLDQSANECVAKWRFKPGTRDGKPVKMKATVEVSFRLLDKA